MLPPLPKIRGKSAPQYLEKGTVLNKRYRVVSGRGIGEEQCVVQDTLAGGGGFGQIYKATDEKTNKLVAVKVEPLCVEAGRMVLEQQVREREVTVVCELQ